MIGKRMLKAQCLRSLYLLLATLGLLSDPGAFGQAPAVQSNSTLFLPAVTYDSGGVSAFSLAVADLNGDGKADVVTTNLYCYRINNPCVGVLLGNGNGTFQPAVDYATGGGNPWSVVLADVNGDARVDILVANEWSDTVGVLLGNGNGTFQPARAYASGGSQPWSIAVADVNGDGKPDIGLANANSDTVGVLLGNGDGTFRTAVAYGSGGHAPDSIVFADVNGDSKPDLLVMNYGVLIPPNWGVIGVLLGNGDGTFQTAVTYGLGQPGYSIVVRDVNGDSKPDLLAAQGYLSLLLGNGDGTFQPPVDCNSGIGAFSVTVIDVNADGKLDALMALGNQSDVAVQLGNGDGTFGSPLVYASGGYYAHQVAVADANGDGKPDLLVANRCTDSTCPANGSVGVLLNNTAPDITPPNILASAIPRLLRPPNGAMVPVVVSGKITDTGSGVKVGSAGYTVQDQYHLIQPQGNITLDTTGNYSFTILLRASLESGEANPHQYTIRVTAFDNAGNRAVKWARVTVPRN